MAATLAVDGTRGIGNHVLAGISLSRERTCHDEVSPAREYAALHPAGILSAGMKPASAQVLVVDDDPGMRAALETSFLRTAGGWKRASGAPRSHGQVSAAGRIRWW